MKTVNPPPPPKKPPKTKKPHKNIYCDTFQKDICKGFLCGGVKEHSKYNYFGYEAMDL